MEQDGATRTKKPKAQLSKGMEHMRSYVTVPEADPASAAQSPATDSATDINGEAAYGVPAAFQPVRKPATESGANPEKRTDPFQFGSRFLEEGDDIFAYNAWDHVETDDAYKSFIETQADFQRASPVSDFDKKRFTEHPEKWWDKFYSNNQANFFKDRKWLVQEFPVLGEVTKAEYGPVTILETGAGAGNTAFPILALNKNPKLKLHACDYSKKAIQVIRGQEAYDGDVLQADVWDAAGSGDQRFPPGLTAGSVDIVIMIFIFSALSPSQWTQAIQNVWDLLKPGGTLLFRDYGRGDLAQVRFKKGRYLEENFYARGDGTRVYFFEKEELARLWTGVGREEQVDFVEATEKLGDTHLEPAQGPAPKTPPTLSQDDIVQSLQEGAMPTDEASLDNLESTIREQSLEELLAAAGYSTEVTKVEDEATPSTALAQTTSAVPSFEIVNLGVDRRMLVNRQRKLKMYRCWMQGLFRKPDTATQSG